MFVGRKKELEKLKSLIEKPESSFGVVYGRRRVGKTELIRQFCRINDLEHIEISGTVDYSTRQQIKLFSKTIGQYYQHDGNTIQDWIDAFELLKEYIATKDKNKKIVIFFDEVPWLDKPKSGFLGALANFWNDYCTKESHIILIACGSAASYMLKKIIHNRGNLHGRLTIKLPVRQFDLHVTKELLTMKGCKYSDKNIADTYIALGGVAKYLSLIDHSKTFNENINNLCFEEGGILKREYSDLYESLFKNAKHHLNIMNLLTSKWSGYTQQELAKSLNVSMTYAKKPLDELLASGFVTATTKFNHKKKEMIFRASDCFSYFQNKWLQGGNIKDWGNIVSSGNYNIWAGYAFENLCHMHIDHIKKILGVSAIDANYNYWAYKPKSKNESGAQIDLMIEYLDRSKNIDIIECKYYSDTFVINKQYRNELLRKISVFNKETDSKYNLRLIFVTLYGVEKNEYYNELVNKDITLSEIIDTSL